MSRAGAVASWLLLACALQGCCFRGCEAGADLAPSPVPVQAQVLRIVAWGPEETLAGVPFNRQPNGQSALWIQLDRSVEGRVVLVRFGDAYLEASVAGSGVTASVPMAAYASAGARDVSVVATSGNARWTSDRVSFKVR